jgi:hypothetical protein
MPQLNLATKLFTLADVQRCPISISPEAQDYLAASHHEARLLPQALQEHFGTLENVVSISLDLEAQGAYRPSQCDTEALLLVVTVHHQDSSKDHKLLLHTRNLREIHPQTKLPAVQARHIAQSLVRSHRHRV